MSIENFLVMASSGFSHTARAVRLWVGIVGVSVELSVKLPSGDDMLGVLDSSESWVSG